jgi:hypothetical protein
LAEYVFETRGAAGGFCMSRRCPKFEVGLAYLQFFEEKILKSPAICHHPLLDVKQYVFGDICVPLSRTSL